MASSKTSTNSKSQTKQQTQSQSTGGSNSTTNSASVSGSTTNTTTYSHSTSGSHTDTSSRGGAHSESTGVSRASGDVDAYTKAMYDLASRNYQPSDLVKQTQQQLKDLSARQPNAYQSPYTTQLNELLGQITNPEKFRYNFNEDENYQNMRDLAVRQGRQNSADAQAQAAGLTGGYGSSYGQTAGQQQMQASLNSLYNQIPALRERAYQEWLGEQQLKQNAYNALTQADTTAYNRNRDTAADWRSDRSYLASLYGQLQGQEYNQYANDRSFWQNEKWNQINREHTTNSASDQSNWAKSQSDSRGWQDTVSNSVSNTTGWQRGTSTTAATNWQNSLSNSVSDTISSGTSSTLSSGSGSGGSSSHKTGNMSESQFDSKMNQIKQRYIDWSEMSKTPEEVSKEHPYGSGSQGSWAADNANYNWQRAALAQGQYYDSETGQYVGTQGAGGMTLNKSKNADNARNGTRLSRDTIVSNLEGMTEDQQVEYLTELIDRDYVSPADVAYFQKKIGW